MSTRIYIAMHKRDDRVLKVTTDPIYIPIHCGKAIYEDEGKGYLPELGDDTGDNLSARNKNYCELTGMYWVWKNVYMAPDDIVGFNHYRRYFSEPDTDNMKPITEDGIKRLLSDKDFIVNGSGTEFTDANSEFSVYDGYKGCHCITDLDNALEGTRIYFPDLYSEIERQVKHSAAMALCNIFITRKKFLDEYCNYLFTVLKYVDSKVNYDEEEHKGYGGRVLGFLGERLFRPWIIASGHTGVAAGCLNWEEYSGYIWE